MSLMQSWKNSLTLLRGAKLEEIGTKTLDAIIPTYQHWFDAAKWFFLAFIIIDLAGMVLPVKILLRIQMPLLIVIMGFIVFTLFAVVMNVRGVVYEPGSYWRHYLLLMIPVGIIALVFGLLMLPWLQDMHEERLMREVLLAFVPIIYSNLAELPLVAFILFSFFKKQPSVTSLWYACGEGIKLFFYTLPILVIAHVVVIVAGRILGIALVFLGFVMVPLGLITLLAALSACIILPWSTNLYYVLYNELNSQTY